MDIIDAFVKQLNLTENAARGLAGQVFGLVEDTVREKVSYGVASKVRSAIPELLQWQSSSPTIIPGSLSVHETPLPGGANEEVELVRLLERFRVDVSKSALVGSLSFQFLASRLDAKTMATISRTMSWAPQSS